MRIKAGQVLLAAGQRVTPDVQERLARLNQAIATSHPWGVMASFAILASGLMLLGGWYFRRSGVPNWPSRKQAYLTLSVTLVSALVAIATYLAGRGFAAGLGIEPMTADFLPPVALVSVLLALLSGARGSLLAGTLLSIFVAYRVDSTALTVSYYLVGVLSGGLIARGSRRRHDLMRLGVAVGVAQAAMVPVIFVLAGKTLDISLLPAMAAALSSGLLTAFASAGLLPLFEQVFEETTTMRLVELASADSPLLKQLALQSPGTFYHSMIMSNLAEAAGDAIGANGLQCRVMALYHDIGKMVRPSYFAENQRGANIHDRLPPDLSARIIFAHIKDGIDLARKHRLGRPVLDAVTQHQGTTLLRVFYMKALERAKTTGESVDENEFRYPGPRPRTREAAILLLADAAEAATRALKEPSPADLRERVHKVVQEKVADRQLDECGLTLKDLNRIEAAFVRTLTLGVYHSRIEYPPPPRVVPAATKEDGGTRDRDYGRQSSLGERGS
jgi:putative nucleotidyltransferase with HDIG domain